MMRYINSHYITLHYIILHCFNGYYIVIILEQINLTMTMTMTMMMMMRYCNRTDSLTEIHHVE